MPNNNFIQLVKNAKSNANPQQIVLTALERPMSSSPIGANLINLAKEGKTAEIEKIARNILASQGKDFDKEFTAFKKQWGFE